MPPLSFPNPIPPPPAATLPGPSTHAVATYIFDETDGVGTSEKGKNNEGIHSMRKTGTDGHVHNNQLHWTIRILVLHLSCTNTKEAHNEDKEYL